MTTQRAVTWHDGDKRLARHDLIGEIRAWRNTQKAKVEFAALKRIEYPAA